MKSKVQTFTKSMIGLALLLGVLFPISCDIFEADGTSSSSVVRGGYFYLMERSTASLIMFDSRLNELKRWNVFRLTNDSSMQGITFDGAYLWISSAGGSDQIFRIDASGDTLIALKVLSAPPSKRGTVRDLAWDGTYIWALNSGSITSSIPATLYKLDPSNGNIVNEYRIPSHDPRGLTYVPEYTDVYGRTASAGLVYTDVTTNKMYKFLPELSAFDTLFTSPTPPRGTSYVYPAGITYDGEFYWVTNSSNTADHLYKLSYIGHEESRYDLPFSQPGPVVFAREDARLLPAPTVTAVSPNTGVQGRSLAVDVFGAEFSNRAGLSVSFGSGITVDSISWISSGQIRSYVRIDSMAVSGKRSVTVTNPGGRSTTVADVFEVTLTPPLYNLWLIELNSDTLYHIRFADTASIQQRWYTRTIAPGHSPQGLTYDGTNIWLCASGTDRKIMKVRTDTTSLVVLKSLNAPTSSGTLRGLAWESGSLWLAVSAIGASGRIYRLDPDAGTVQDSIPSPGVEPRGIVFANGQLYCNDTSLDSVFVYNTSTQSWRGVFATPTPPGGTTSARFATGMTWDGSNFWIANSSNDFDHVFRVSPMGIVLQYFASPRIGTAQLTGLVYTP